MVLTINILRPSAAIEGQILSDHVVYPCGKGWLNHSSTATTSEMPVEKNPDGWRVFSANSISFVVETLQPWRAHRSAVGSGAAEDLQKLTTISASDSLNKAVACLGSCIYHQLLQRNKQIVAIALDEVRNYYFNPCCDPDIPAVPETAR